MDDPPAPPARRSGGPGARRPRRGRLSRSAEFDRVYRHGRSVGDRYLVVHVFPRAQGPEVAGRASGGPRLGLSVSRKVGGAVERNRVKRLLREAFDAAAPSLPGDHDVVVVARPDARELAEHAGLAGVRASLDDLLGKALGEGRGAP